MGASKSSEKKYEFYKLKIIKESDVPMFFRREKQGEQWAETEQFDTISGYLKKVETGSYTHEGKEKKTFKMVFDDNNGESSIQVEGNFNNMTRTMFNSLCGMDSIGLVELRAKLWGKPGAKKYPTVFVDVNGQKSNWKYKYTDLPQIEEIKNKKGEVLSKDDTEVNDFYINNVIPEINSKIVSEFEVAAEMNQRTPQATASKTTSALAPDSKEISDDLPFAIALLFTIGSLATSML